MPFNKYYQDELTFLNDLGKEFAHNNPKLAPFLANRGNDPDVERLLEGFAFLSGRLRQKLDDELPELTHTLLALLWPNYLRPIPAMTILQFDPAPSALTDKQTISRGCEVDSIPVEGTPCHFKTCYDVDVYPLHLDSLELERVARGSVLTLRFLLEGGTGFAKLKMDKLRLYLHGETYITYALYLWLCQHLDGVTVRAAGGYGAEFELPLHAVRPVGFGKEESLLPYPDNVFPGYRLLQEYFSLTEKFLFIDIGELDGVKDFDAEGFDLVFRFSKPLDDQVRLKKSHIRLYCTPIVNLFPLDASPVRLDNRRVEYLIRPEGRPPEHYEVYSIDKVEGQEQGTAQRQPYYAFESFDHAREEDGARIYYRMRVRPGVTDEQGVDTYIAFVNSREQQAFPPQETISLELMCSNRHLPEELKEGEVRVATGSSPEFVTFQNITMLTSSLPPPLQAGLHWRLISNMSLNYISLAGKEALQTLLSAYNFGAYYNAQAARESKLRLEGIEDVKTQPADVLHHGMPIRGIRTHMTLRESNFAGEGDLYLFASVLNEFLALYASINSFHQLNVSGVERGEHYQWTARLGQQFLI
ncbi:MAG: type VI secretion system baseplate subunit TssF [Gammaproteobacteria bacterium]|nr:type VI secretion system baseplate subunit TssF [Gammaproteobacteria bacterium]